MTVESFTPAETFTVMGTGPYTVPFSYGAGSELDVTVNNGTTISTLLYATDYTVDPDGGGSSGTITLSSAAATAWAGADMDISRASLQEQGWAAQGGEREKGLENQLDQMVRGIQDNDQRIRASFVDVTRMVRAPQNDGVEMQLPGAGDRANQIMAFGPAGAPVMYADAITPTVLAEGEAVFSTALLVPLATIDAAVDVIQTKGYAAAGDGGAARYKRVGAAPSHDAKLQSADGAWWEIAVDFLRPEQLGAVIGDGTTDERAALLSAHNAQVALQIPLVFYKIHACDGDLEIVVSSYDERVMMASILPLVGGVRFFGSGGYDLKHGDGSVTLVRPDIQGLLVEDGEDVAAWIAKPLLRTWRTSFARVEGCKFDGKDRRTEGAKFGHGDTIWASYIARNQFINCEIGVVVGDTKDATHNYFTNNTVDHNKACGAIFCNPTGGRIVSNSFEQNEGKTALAILSQANGGPSNALNVEISGNYIYNNAIDHPGHADANAILIGYDVPDTSYTSAVGVWMPRVHNNYIVSANQKRAIKANIQHWGSIKENVVLNDGADAFDIELAGATSNVMVKGNKNQALAAFDRVYVASGGWGQPLVIYNTLSTIPTGTTFYWGFSSDADAIMSPTGTWHGTDDIDITQRRTFVGALVAWFTGGGVDRVLFDIATDIPNGTRARIKFSGTVSQTNGNNEQLLDFELTPDLKDGAGVVDTSAALTVTHAPLTPRDNRVLTYSGGQLLMRSDNNWVMNGKFEVSTLFG